jgi:hypothetical protein
MEDNSDVDSDGVAPPINLKRDGSRDAKLFWVQSSWNPSNSISLSESLSNIASSHLNRRQAKFMFEHFYYKNYNFWRITARNFKSGSKYWQLNCVHFNHTILGSFHSTLWRTNSLNTQVSFFCFFFFVYICRVCSAW